eukprot:9259144-Alexandrium_andersonii.AAC.1
MAILTRPMSARAARQGAHAAAPEKARRPNTKGAAAQTQSAAASQPMLARKSLKRPKEAVRMGLRHR